MERVGASDRGGASGVASGAARREREGGSERRETVSTQGVAKKTAREPRRSARLDACSLRERSSSPTKCHTLARQVGAREPKAQSLETLLVDRRAIVIIRKEDLGLVVFVVANGARILAVFRGKARRLAADQPLGRHKLASSNGILSSVADIVRVWNAKVSDKSEKWRAAAEKCAATPR